MKSKKSCCNSLSCDTTNSLLRLLIGEQCSGEAPDIVVPEDPDVITPPVTLSCNLNNETPLVFDPYGSYPEAGIVHAKYRMNGGDWINYSEEHIDNRAYSDVMTLFLESITYEGRKVFEILGSGYEAWFHCYRGKSTIIGGATQSPYPLLQRSQDDVIEPLAIEFMSTDLSQQDLVMLAFGIPSVTINSCGFVGWAGL